MMRRPPTFRLRLRHALVLALGLALGTLTRAENLTISPVYPPPSGSYKKLIATDEVFLARRSGNVILAEGGGRVGIGLPPSGQNIWTPTERLEVFGNVASVDAGLFRSQGGAPRLDLRETDFPNADWSLRVNAGSLMLDEVYDSGASARRLTFSPAGYLGIGYPNPGYRLHVNGDLNASELCIKADCRNSWPSGGGKSLWFASGSSIFYPNEPSNVASRVFIGTSGGFARLQVYGAPGADAAIIDAPAVIMEVDKHSRQFGLQVKSDGFYIGRYIGDSVEKDFYVSNSGSVYERPSSRRFKRNVRPLEQALETVSRLRGVEFEWKSTGRRSLGLVAEEVAEVFPEFVGFEEGRPAGIQYELLTAVLLEAVKEQESQIQTRQKAIEELRRELEVLKARGGGRRSP